MSHLACDPPVHRRYRELADPFFSVLGAEKQRGLITGIVDELLDGIVAERASASSCSDFAMPLPVRVITTMMGFRVEDIPELKVWSEAWVLPFRGQLTADEEIYAGEKGVEFQHHIHATIQEKRANPDDSVISFLANEARFNGERPLTDAEIIGMADHLYIGGNETTTFALTSGLWLLLTHPDVHAALLADRSKVKGFVEEVLRLESPTMGMVRHAHEDARDRRRRHPGRLEPPPPLRRGQPRSAGCSRTRPSSTSTGRTPTVTWPSRSARRTARAPGSPASSR